MALSVSPERIRGAHASIEHQAIASTAFSALVDALFISLIGLQGGGPLNLLAQRLGVDRPLASAPVAEPDESGPAPGAH